MIHPMGRITGLRYVFEPSVFNMSMCTELHLTHAWVTLI